MVSSLTLAFNNMCGELAICGGEVKWGCVDRFVELFCEDVLEFELTIV